MKITKSDKFDKFREIPISGSNYTGRAPNIEEKQVIMEAPLGPHNRANQEYIGAHLGSSSCTRVNPACVTSLRERRVSGHDRAQIPGSLMFFEHIARSRAHLLLISRVAKKRPSSGLVLARLRNQGPSAEYKWKQTGSSGPSCFQLILFSGHCNSRIDSISSCHEQLLVHPSDALVAATPSLLLVLNKEHTCSNHSRAEL